MKTPASVSAAALLAAACATDRSRDVDAYRDAVDAFVSQARGAPPGAAPVPRDRAGDVLAAARARGALTLDDCFAAAVDVSEQLAIAGESFLQQRFARDESLAKLFPTLSATGTEFRQDPVRLPGASGSGSVFTITDERHQAALTFTQPLFRGMREFASLRQKEDLGEARRQDLATATRGLYVETARVFYATLAGEAEVKTIEDTLRLEEERYREMEARRQQGLARRTEVLLVESEMESDRARLTRARNALKLLRLQLGFLLGTPVDLPLRDTVEDAPAAPDPAPLIEAALRCRSDLLAREAEMKAASEQVAVVLGEYWGSLDFTGNYYAYRGGYSTFQKETDYDLLLTYTVPLFEGGGTKARYASARSLERQAGLARDAVRRQIDVDVRSAHLELLSADALRADLAAALRSAEENYKLLNEEYRQGIATNLEVQTASRLLAEARLALDRQRLDRKVSWVRLRVAQGLLPEKP